MMTATIKNWYWAPRGEGCWAVGGEVYGHPEFVDGVRIHTSPVEQRRRKLIITKSGTRYILDGKCLNPYIRNESNPPIPKLSLE